MASNVPTNLLTDFTNLTTLLIRDPITIPVVIREDWTPAGQDFQASNPLNWTPNAAPFLFDDLHINSGQIDINGNDLDGAVLTIGDDAHRSAGIDTTVRLHDATADIKVYTPDPHTSRSAADVRPVIEAFGQTNTLTASFLECVADINMQGASLEGTCRIDSSSLHISDGIAFVNHSLDLTSASVTIDAPVTGTGTVNIGFGVFDSHVEFTKAVSPGQTVIVHGRDAVGINLTIDDVADFKGGIDLHEGRVLLVNVLNIDHFVFTGDFLSLVDKSGTAVDTIKLTESGGVSDTGNFHPMLVSQTANGIMLDNSGQPPIGTVLSAVD